MPRIASSVALAAALAIAGSAARAQAAADADPAASAGGATRLDLGLGLLGFEYRQAAATESATGHLTFGFNLGPVPSTRVALGVGRSVSDRLSVGARVALGLAARQREQAENGERGSDLTFDWAVLPYLERALGAGRIRPFLTVAAGVEGTVTRATMAGGNDMGGWTDVRVGKLVAGAIGLGVGLRAFVADRVSLELSLLETAAIGRLTETWRYEGEQGEGDDTAHLAWRARTELLVGITGWI